MKMLENEPFQPEFAKPGKPPKKPRNNQKKIGRGLEVPKEKECQYLDFITATESFRHAEAPEVKFLDGGGITGSRINDRLTAWLSDEVDRVYSEKLPASASELERTQRALFTAIMIIKTHLL